MIRFIFFVVIVFYALYINCSWKKHCDEINDRWTEEYGSLYKKYTSVYFKLMEEKKRRNNEMRYTNKFENNFEKCNGCPYYFGEIDQCMVGEEDVPDNLEKKCKKGGEND